AIVSSTRTGASGWSGPKSYEVSASSQITRAVWLMQAPFPWPSADVTAASRADVQTATPARAEKFPLISDHGGSTARRKFMALLPAPAGLRRHPGRHPRP